jgi:hypothetical protein
LAINIPRTKYRNICADLRIINVSELFIITGATGAILFTMVELSKEDPDADWLEKRNISTSQIIIKTKAL